MPAKLEILGRDPLALSIRRSMDPETETLPREVENRMALQLKDYQHQVRFVANSNNKELKYLYIGSDLYEIVSIRVHRAVYFMFATEFYFTLISHQICVISS